MALAGLHPQDSPAQSHGMTLRGLCFDSFDPSLPTSKFIRGPLLMPSHCHSLSLSRETTCSKWLRMPQKTVLFLCVGGPKVLGQTNVTLYLQHKAISSHMLKKNSRSPTKAKAAWNRMKVILAIVLPVCARNNHDLLFTLDLCLFSAYTPPQHTQAFCSALKGLEKTTGG